MDTFQSSALYRGYHFFNHYLTDDRTKEYPLILRPFTIMFLLAFYNFFCLKLGPRLMKHRQPFQLRTAIILFDLFQIIINIYILIEAWSIWLFEYNFFCQPMIEEDGPASRRSITLIYLYLLVKISDLIDTVFMVLRKKYSHISFLHLYHHTGMVIMIWATTKYIPVGHHSCLGLYNAPVHMVMYTYYLTAALFPDLKMPRFKRLVTQMQMTQFALICIHASTVLFVPGCSYATWPLHVIIPNNAYMFLLFYDFYRKTYVLNQTPNNGKQDCLDNEKSKTD